MSSNEQIEADYPLVSCIMPVYGARSGLVAAALASYLNQSYVYRQLVVVDDTPEPLRDLFVGVAGLGESELIYVHSPQRLTVGAKRNLAVNLSDGEIIIHFDSDDLSASGRVAEQVRTLVTCGKPIIGYHTVPLYDTITRETYLYHQSKTLICGASLCYWKAYAEAHPFPDVMVNEDVPYCIERPADRHAVDGSRSILILLHDSNISTRRIAVSHPTVFRKVNPDIIPPKFFSLYSEHFVGYDPVVN